MTEESNESNFTRKDKYWGVVAYGVKSEESKTSANLNEANFKHHKIVIDDLERIVLKFEGGDIYELDIVDYINDRYKLKGVIGYGLGKNHEVLETVLKRIMCAGGIVPVEDTFVGDFRKVGSDHLKDMMECYARNRNKESSEDKGSSENK